MQQEQRLLFLLLLGEVLSISRLLLDCAFYLLNVTCVLMKKQLETKYGSAVCSLFFSCSPFCFRTYLGHTVDKEYLRYLTLTPPHTSSFTLTFLQLLSFSVYLASAR